MCQCEGKLRHTLVNTLRGGSTDNGQEVTVSRVDTYTSASYPSPSPSRKEVH